MNPTVGILIIEEVFKLTPGIVAGVHALLAKGEPTAEDWQKLREHTASLEPFKIPE